MADTKGQPDGEHIEELLSQLKGIFGHLSETEQEEARQKIAPPAVPARSAPAQPTPASVPEKPEPVAFEAPPAEPIPAESPIGEPIPAQAPGAELSEPFPPIVEAPSNVPPSPDYTPKEVSVPAGATLIPTVIFYPAGKLADAKGVAEKVERITPKFTKVTVVINVHALTVYDPKSDLKSTLVPLVNNSSIKAAFVLTEKTFEEAKRKALIAELEPKGIYFQEIPFHQIEKKALYTDMLLGMVFFFDSQKPTGEPSA